LLVVILFFICDEEGEAPVEEEEAIQESKELMNVEKI